MINLVSTNKNYLCERCLLGEDDTSLADVHHQSDVRAGSTNAAL